MDLYLTGFGAFGDVRENPSSEIVRALKDEEHVVEACVLDVCARESIGALRNMQQRAIERNRSCVFLHFGVKVNAESVVLEKMAYNVADFRIPDTSGWLAKNQEIMPQCEKVCGTSVPIERIAETLVDVSISTDPGRYICNYVYFHSLMWSQEQKKAGKLLGAHALFIHVPPFRKVSKEKQIHIFQSLLSVFNDRMNILQA